MGFMTLLGFNQEWQFRLYVLQVFSGGAIGCQGGHFNLYELPGFKNFMNICGRSFQDVVGTGLGFSHELAFLVCYSQVSGL